MADFQLCGNFKTRYVINGYLTKEPIEIVHSVAEPNNFKLWGAADTIENLQSLTKVKLCTVKLKSYKNKFLLSTIHHMVQHLEEHIGMMTF